MSFINAYCVDDLTISRWEGYDEWNEPFSPTPIRVKGYIEWKRRLVRDLRGEEVISEITIYLPKKIDNLLERGLLHEDKILLVGEIKERSIIDINKPKAFSGFHYEVAIT